MEYGYLNILHLLGALGFFIYGMKVMSEGIQKAAGNSLRKILSTMTRNRYLGVATGFIVTCLVQSSSASTVMAVSFVNAGLLSLVESAGIMLGANIGTTITGWLVAVLGFKVKIAALALPLLAFGVPMLFSKRNKLQYIGEFIIGFAILFWGLSELKNAVPDIKGNPEILNFLGAYAESGFLSNLFFILVGTLLTILVQSSSASMALTQTLCFSGIIPFEVAAAMILGENIGTTITAELASLPANVHAKRSARIHSMFNIVGVSWAVLLISFTPVLEGVRFIAMELLGSADPYSAEGAPMGLAIFHTSFNFLNVAIMIGFVPLLVRLATKTVPSKGELDEEYHLEYISTGLMNTAELSIEEARKETVRFGELTQKMSKVFRDLIDASKTKKQSKLIKKIRSYEEMTDRMELEISEYLLNVSGAGSLSASGTQKITSLLSAINDLERIGDIFFQMSKDVERNLKNEKTFKNKQIENILQMMDLVDQALSIMVSNLESANKKIHLEPAMKVELEINRFRNQLRKGQSKDIEKEKYDPKRDSLYKDIFHLCEKLGDHIINVSEAITGEKERELKEELELR
ncbi:MAG: Na/Pi cotransporter family protein [Cyclobacteriaceae bacterium]